MNSLTTVKLYLSRYIGFVVLGVLTIAAGLTILNYIWPKYQEIQNTRAQIVTLKQQQTDLTTYVAYLKQLQATSLPVEEDLVNYALPSENDVISLIVTYEGLVKTPDMHVSPFDFAPGLIQNTKDKITPTPAAPAADITDEGTGAATQTPQTTQSRELEFHMKADTTKPEAALDFINKIHQTRRVFSIKSLTWTNPDKDALPEDRDKIVLEFSLGTYYYPSAPRVNGSTELVKKGQTQEDLIAKLKSTTAYDSLVLDSVEVGKDDLFTAEGSTQEPTPVPNPTPEKTLEATPSATITQPVTF